ncbi:MAG: hypothetical protein M0P71_11920 [Melioribacteraceae bacterium]|jgi:phosphoribosyl 1,2-cyclic phosphodiesterase|nr:hypothetical protein [Melioribacteraceae bacterium]
MKLKVLGSSSSGNCYILEAKNSALIIECGVKFIEVKKALDFNTSVISGAIVSHLHGDHSKYIYEYANAGIDVYIQGKTFPSLENNGIHRRIYPFINDIKFQLFGFNIYPFELKHDVPCSGFIIYNFECGNTLFLTDTHYCPYRFKNLNNIIIEANYDNDMLEENIFEGRIPEIVRNRVINSHMSIETCKNLLKANDLSRVNNIVLIHLSGGNSNAIRFKKEVEDLTGKQVYIAEKNLIIDFNTHF